MGSRTKQIRCPSHPVALAPPSPANSPTSPESLSLSACPLLALLPGVLSQFHLTFRKAPQSLGMSLSPTLGRSRADNWNHFLLPWRCWEKGGEHSMAGRQSRGAPPRSAARPSVCSASPPLPPAAPLPSTLHPKLLRVILVPCRLMGWHVCNDPALTTSELSSEPLLICEHWIPHL